MDGGVGRGSRRKGIHERERVFSEEREKIKNSAGVASRRAAKEASFSRQLVRPSSPSRWLHTSVSGKNDTCVHLITGDCTCLSLLRFGGGTTNNADIS